MIDKTKTMKETVLADPLFGDFLVYKGFPFSLDNPIVELVTFADVIQVQQLNEQEFLAEYERYRSEADEAVAWDQTTARRKV